MDALSKVHEFAAERMAAKHALLGEVRAKARSRELRTLDPGRLVQRVARLLRNPLIATQFGDAVRGELTKVIQSGDDAEFRSLSDSAQGGLERVLGGSDLVPAWFLARGAELRRTVARVRARYAGEQDMGTGFLVGPRLLLTNYHVLDWRDLGKQSFSEIVPQSLVEFDYEEQFDGSMRPITKFQFDPTTLLLTSSWDRLDYVLVALQPQSQEGRSAEDFGYNRLAGDLGKIAVGEPVFIVQHPLGQPKQVILQNNHVIAIDPDYMTYEADTDRGSSGSPVYNQQWEVVALHHSSEIARDGQGRILARSGGVWTPDKGAGDVKYLELNEGVRVSDILADLSHKLALLAGGAHHSQLEPGEQCSSEGLGLLKDLLATRREAAPEKLVAPIPVERSASSAPGKFPKPD